MSDAQVNRTLVRKIRLFATLDDFDADALIAHARPRVLERGDVLYRQGELDDSLGIVVEGMLLARLHHADGSWNEVGQYMPGEVVGEMECFDPAERAVTVLAVGPATVLELDREALRVLGSEAPSVVAEIVAAAIRDTTGRLRGIDERIEKMIAGRIQPTPVAPDTELEPTVEPQPTTPRLPTGAARHMASTVMPRVEPTPSRPPAGVISRLESRPVPVTARDLGAIPALKDYAASEREVLAAVATGHYLEAGAVLCREGEPGRSCFLIVAGEVDVARRFDDAERLLAILGPGAMVGQMALVDRGPRSATVRARTRSLAIELDRDVFDRLLRTRSPFALRFQEQIAIAGIRQLRLATDKLAKLLASAPRPRGERRRQPNDTQNLCLAVLQAALNEWDVSAEDLESAVVVRPEGALTQAELKSRGP